MSFFWVTLFSLAPLYSLVKLIPLNRQVRRNLKIYLFGGRDGGSFRGS